jgi:hypothetical protein
VIGGGRGIESFYLRRSAEQNRSWWVGMSMSVPEPSASHQVISSMAVNQVNKALRCDSLLPLSFVVLL